ncbi:MAG: D-Ala-D-Ala carboxypeptidase family metallohydrolase [Bacteroidota bacterium]
MTRPAVKLRLSRKHLYFCFLSLVILGVGAAQFWRVRDLLNEWAYRMTHSDAPIETKAEMQAVLAAFELVPFADISTTYKVSTGSDQAPFAGMLSSKSYYLLPGDAIYQKVVGHHRIKDFLPKDSHYRQHVLNLNGSDRMYWLIHVRLLEKVLELQQRLEQEGYDETGFQLVNGYRPPKYNEAVGGASRSRHLVGEAVDIVAKDVNQDGKANQADKAILVKLLDQEIIGNFGGLGKYPGTMSIHFDVRGRRARWDQQ